MPTTDNAIIEGDRLPERGVFPPRFVTRTELNFYEQVVLSPEPDYVIVLVGPGSDGTWSKALTSVSFSEWDSEVSNANRYYRVSTSRQLIERELDVACKDDDTQFRATVVVVLSVRTDGAKSVYANYGNRGESLNEVLGKRIDEVVREHVKEFSVDVPSEAAAAVKEALERKLDTSEFELHRCAVLFEPDAGSVERSRMVKTTRVENQLREEQAKHERDLFETRREYEQSKAASAEARETARIGHEQTMLDMQKKLEKERVEHRNELERMQQEQSDRNATATASREREEARLINDQIGSDPRNAIGYLLALEDTKLVREAIKLAEERDRTEWERERERNQFRWERARERERARSVREKERNQFRWERAKERERARSEREKERERRRTERERLRWEQLREIKKLRIVEDDETFLRFVSDLLRDDEPDGESNRVDDEGATTEGSGDVDDEAASPTGDSETAGDTLTSRRVDTEPGDGSDDEAT